MNTLTKNLFILLLLSSTFILPACGSKEINSEKNPTTTLKSSSTVIVPPMINVTATATVTSTMTAIQAIPPSLSLPTQHLYTKKIAMVRHRILPHQIKLPLMAAITPLVSSAPTPIPTAIAFSTTPEPQPKKHGSHWPIILAILALIIALAFYFWTKKAPPHNDFPLPPMGGLSPVGGFSGMQNKIQRETKKRSIWAKKIF